MRLRRIMKCHNTHIISSVLTLIFISVITLSWNYKPNLIETEANIYEPQQSNEVTEKIRNIENSQIQIQYINLTIIRQRNTDRIERLNFYCKSQPKLQALPSSTRLYTVFSLNFGITLIAKVASTTWALFLSQIQCRECINVIDPPRYVQLHDCVRSKLLIDRKLGYNAMLVRNPWTRLISVYKDKVVKSDYKRPAVKSCQERWKLSENTTLSFSNFVDCILEKQAKPETLDPHMMPQFLMHGPCSTGYSHILKLESMSEDLVNLVDTANPDFSPQKVSDIVQQLRSQERRSWETDDPKSKIKSYLELYETLNSEQISNLQLMYRWDCHLYKYGINPLDEESYSLLL